MKDIETYVPNSIFPLLGGFTFLMPLACIVLVAWVSGELLGLISSDPPQWFLDSALWLTFIMWPSYFAWTILSHRLEPKQKLQWVFYIFVGNMIVMPAFYVFMRHKKRKSI